MGVGAGAERRHGKEKEGRQQEVGVVEGVCASTRVCGPIRVLYPPPECRFPQRQRKDKR